MRHPLFRIRLLVIIQYILLYAGQNGGKEAAGNGYRIGKQIRQRFRVYQYAQNPGNAHGDEGGQRNRAGIQEIRGDDLSQAEQHVDGAQAQVHMVVQTDQQHRHRISAQLGVFADADADSDNQAAGCGYGQFLPVGSVVFEVHAVAAF